MLYLELAAVALVPVALSIFLYLLDTKTKFGNISRRKKQIIIGILFGLLAISGTEFGIKIDGAVINARDAAPLCAGLIFGGPAGIIAGCIGGVERFFASYWGAGTFTQIACTVSTIFAGVFAAVFRRFMSNSRIPRWYYGILTGLFAETFHMLLVFVTNMNNIEKAYEVVSICTLPMLIVNTAAVTLAVLAVNIMSYKRKKKDNTEKRKRLPQLSKIFQLGLFICVMIAFLATGIFTYIIQNSVSVADIQSTLSDSITNVKTDIQDTCDRQLVESIVLMTAELEKQNISCSGNNSGKDVNAILEQMLKTYDVSEITLANTNGIATYSTNEKSRGFDFNKGVQSREFLKLLDGSESVIVQDFRERSDNKNLSMKYAGISAPQLGGFVQAGYNHVLYKDLVDEIAERFLQNRTVGRGGFILVAYNDQHHFNIVCDTGSTDDYTGRELTEVTGTGFVDNLEYKNQGSVFEQELQNSELNNKHDEGLGDSRNRYYCMFEKIDNYYIVGFLPVYEATFSRNVSLLILQFIEIIIFGALFLLISFLIDRQIVRNIGKINHSLSNITKGNLDTVVDVHNTVEFASLSTDINSTVSTLKGYIEAEAQRLDQELEFAKNIQSSSLPNHFPPYPNNKEFDIFACMKTAKEVGGDFYDFYFVDSTHLAFIVADVSGKGIPAALFMMRAKSVISSLAETQMPIAQVITEANNSLCHNNEAGMFVTAWMGILDIESGALQYVNAGHNPPVIYRYNQECEYLKGKRGFILAGMENMVYRVNDIKLEPGDKLFLYTDGVTEAENTKEELYGEDRLLKTLQLARYSDVEKTCDAVSRDVDSFAYGREQFDDITMLCIRYNGIQDSEDNITVTSEITNLSRIYKFLDSALASKGCSEEIISLVDLAVCEIFTNVAQYAYTPKVGDVTIKFNFIKYPAAVDITIIDKGRPYNPIQDSKSHSYLDLDKEQGKGMGLIIVNKTMDNIYYEYKDGCNILTIRKNL